MIFNLNLISPSGYCPADKYELALKQWQSLGYNIANIDIGYRKYLRFGGTDAQRLADFSFSNLDIQPTCHNIIMPIRGGYGLSRILEQINWHQIADTINQYNLKVIGHSDFTLFNLALLSLTNTISLSGPMFTSDFGVENVNPFMLESFSKAINNQDLCYKINALDVLDAQNYNIDGILWGGNLAMLCSIIGTKYLPKTRGILFFEDINEHPYRVERMLYQLYHNNILQNQKAIIFGDFSGYKLTSYDNGYNFDELLSYWRLKLKPYNIPIFTHLLFGHCYAKATLPIGAKSYIQTIKDNYYLNISFEK